MPTRNDDPAEPREQRASSVAASVKMPSKLVSIKSCIVYDSTYQLYPYMTSFALSTQLWMRCLRVIHCLQARTASMREMLLTVFLMAAQDLPPMVGGDANVNREQLLAQRRRRAAELAAREAASNDITSLPRPVFRDDQHLPIRATRVDTTRRRKGALTHPPVALSSYDMALKMVRHEPLLDCSWAQT